MGNVTTNRADGTVRVVVAGSTTAGTTRCIFDAHPPHPSLWSIEPRHLYTTKVSPFVLSLSCRANDKQKRDGLMNVRNKTGQNRTFPLIWRCASKYCTATVGSKAQLGVLDANALVINGTHLDPARVGVRCLEGYRYAAVVDAPLEDRCVTCSVACAPHGTCASNVTKQCACASGWKGPDCRSVVSVTSSSWDAYEYLDTETYNALRPCTLHSDCGAYEKCFVRMAPTNQVGQGYCWCDAGRGPANSTSCGVVGMGVGVAAMGVDVFWATRFTWFVLLDDSRQLWYQPRNATGTPFSFPSDYTHFVCLRTLRMQKPGVTLSVPPIQKWQPWKNPIAFSSRHNICMPFIVSMNPCTFGTQHKIHMAYRVDTAKAVAACVVRMPIVPRWRGLRMPRRGRVCA